MTTYPKVFTLPPDTRAVGQGNPPADVNGLADGMLALGAPYSVMSSVFGSAVLTGTSAYPTPRSRTACRRARTTPGRCSSPPALTSSPAATR